MGKEVSSNPLNQVLPMSEYLLVLVFTRGKPKNPQLFAEAIALGHTQQELQELLDSGILPDNRFVRIRWKHGNKNWRYSSQYSDWQSLSGIAESISVESSLRPDEARWPDDNDRH